MSTRGMWRALLALAIVALAGTGGAAAQSDERGIDPNQGESLVEVTVPSKSAAIELQLEADSYGIDFNEHYLRQNRSGTFTVTVFGNEDELAALDAAGYELGVTIEGPDTWRERISDLRAGRRAENRADAAALGNPVGDPPTVVDEDEIVILRVDYFENYAGRFLSVEAKNRLGGAEPSGSDYIGPEMSLSWNTGAGTPIDSVPRSMNVNIDPDTTPDTYIEHRELVRIPDGAGAPTMIRIGSSTGAIKEAPVNVWLGGGLPPMNSGFLKDFTTRYIDPTEVYARFDELAAEFPNIAELIPLPYETNGYQRRAQATMAGTTLPGSSPSGGTAQSQAVVLTSRAWGHEGGNDITAEFVNPGVPDSPLSVAVLGNDIVVNLATNSTGALSSTASQVVAAINSHPGASALVVALTYRGNAGAGTVQPRAKVN
ncbi:MAG: hypothetical protein ACREJR_02695, partial [Candidatus Rokuibacteriota bacterium]